MPPRPGRYQRVRARHPTLRPRASGEQLGVFGVGPGERRHGTGQVRERGDVVGSLETGAREDRREAQAGRRRARAGRDHDPVDSVDDVFEFAGAAVEPGNRGVDEQSRGEQLLLEVQPCPFEFRAVPDGRAGHIVPRYAIDIWAELFMMRSLLTITAAPCASRRCLPSE